MILVRWTEPPPLGPHRWLAGSHSGRMAGHRGSPGGCSRGSSSCTHPDPQCSQYRSRKLCSNFRCTTMSKLFNSLVCCALCSARSFFSRKFIVRSQVALSSPFAFQENIYIYLVYISVDHPSYRSRSSSHEAGGTRRRHLLRTSHHCSLRDPRRSSPPHQWEGGRKCLHEYGPSSIQ